MLENIEYKEYRKKNDIHGTVLYPAVMVAPIQKDIIQELILNNDIHSVFDPFHGSGTALYETMEIDAQMHLVGCDINPLANLITKVKLNGVNESIYHDINKLKELINNPIEIFPYSFPNINKWLRGDIIESIQKIRTAIMQIDNDNNRLFFWYMLCDIIRKYSNTRSSTYKLHIKELDTISRMENSVINDYIKNIEKHAVKFINNSTTNCILYKCDVIDKLSSFENELFDISITSPPYGDNATTVPYGQFSMLALYTIDSKDLELEGWELNNYSSIDNSSLGGRKCNLHIDDYEYNLIAPYLSLISIEKRKKVISFFYDYFNFLRELCRVTKQYIVLTLGNRTVDRIQIDLTTITKQYLEENEFVNLHIAEREIPSKRTPKKTSRVKDKPVNSMNYEYIIIHKRRY